MENLSRFLTVSKKLFINGRKVSVCLGNVSADMDSLVGSIALSQYFNLQNGVTLDNLEDSPYTFWIPVVNSLREDINLKPEQVKHLQDFGV